MIDCDIRRPLMMNAKELNVGELMAGTELRRRTLAGCLCYILRGAFIHLV